MGGKMMTMTLTNGSMIDSKRNSVVHLQVLQEEVVQGPLRHYKFDNLDRHPQQLSCLEYLWITVPHSWNEADLVVDIRAPQKEKIADDLNPDRFLA